jgi:hypothetical protein
METDTRTAAILHGVFSDAEFFGRFARDLDTSEDDFLRSVIAFCMVPFFSLAMHESLRKIHNIDPSIALAFTQDTLDISTRSRHSLKLFEDTKRGIEGQLSYFRDEIFTAHSDRFLGNTWLPLARPFETDLGLYSYGGRLITTTHTATFHAGFEPRKFLAEGSGSYISQVYEEYGRHFGSLGASLEDAGPDTFFKSLNPTDLSDCDVRASKYYRKVFNGPDTPEVNATLTTFRAMVNFADMVLRCGRRRQHLEYTDFKIGYLSLYQVLRSVHILLDDAAYPLSDRSMDIARSIVTTQIAQEITHRSTKPFRNSLMHYNLPPNIDTSRVDLSQPLFGLVPVYFPQHDVPSFIEMVNECASDTAERFEEWAMPR